MTDSQSNSNLLLDKANEIMLDEFGKFQEYEFNGVSFLKAPKFRDIPKVKSVTRTYGDDLVFLLEEARGSSTEKDFHNIVVDIDSDFKISYFVISDVSKMLEMKERQIFKLIGDTKFVNENREVDFKAYLKNKEFDALEKNIKHVIKKLIKIITNESSGVKPNTRPDYF